MSDKIVLVDLLAQYNQIQDEINAAIAGVISETAFIKGKYVDDFEREFATWVETGYCVGVANGTDAIEIALKALGVGPGDEVLVPANTFIATSEAVSANGGIPVFVDQNPELYTMDVSKIEEKITPRTKAIIPVHLYGLPAEMEEIMLIAKRHNLFVLEDCAQAHGARYKGIRIGTFGDAATFSFFPGKNLGAYGDGGGIVTGDEKLAELCRKIANHGRIGKYDHDMEGRNSRLDGLQAAILSVKLKYMDSWNGLRRSHAQMYSKLLAGTPITTPLTPNYSEHVFHLYVIRTKERDALQKYLKEQKIDSGIHYPTPLPLLPAYKDRGYSAADFPVAAAQKGEILSLPLYPELNADQIKRVVGSIQDFLKARDITINVAR